MIVVVDTNIVFSGLLSPEGTISDLLLNSYDMFDFYSPSSILEELNNHQDKILKYSGFSEDEIDFLKLLIFKKVDLIDLESISLESWEKAVELTKDIDEFDAPFIALSLELKASLWTGDKKLLKGISDKGVNWILNTSDIKGLRDKE